MSFAEEVRGELAKLPVRKPCCRRSAASGLLFNASVNEKGDIFVRFKHEIAAEYAKGVFAGQFGNRFSFSESGQCGHRYFDCLLTSSAAEKRFSDGVPQTDCESCRAVFLRSVFLLSGTMSDPHKSFHLEFSVCPERADMLAAFLSDMGYPPKRCVRGDRVGLYYKDGTSIEDLLSAMGSHHAIFELMNTRIEREIRNNENRATNCVTRNIERYVTAAERQMEAIDFLIAKGFLEELPKSLQVTARLRYENPDATLAELTALHNPAVSKSGVNHRLARLLDEAEKHRGGKRL